MLRLHEGLSPRIGLVHSLGPGQVNLSVRQQQQQQQQQQKQPDGFLSARCLLPRFMTYLASFSLSTFHWFDAATLRHFGFSDQLFVEASLSNFRCLCMFSVDSYMRHRVCMCEKQGQQLPAHTLVQSLFCGTESITHRELAPRRGYNRVFMHLLQV